MEMTDLLLVIAAKLQNRYYLAFRASRCQIVVHPVTSYGSCSTEQNEQTLSNAGAPARPKETATFASVSERRWSG